MYGLNAKEVDERIRSGLVNKQQNYEKYAYLKIAARNIFTYFNLIFIVFAVVLISQRAYNHLAFMGAGYVLCAVELSQFFCMYALNRGAFIICILLAVFAYFVKNTAELLKQTRFFNFIVSKTHILRNMRV